jgi:hypothetical protein
MDYRPVEDMTEREIAEESLILLRAFADAFAAATANPMVAAMMPGLAGKR